MSATETGWFQGKECEMQLSCVQIFLLFINVHSKNSQSGVNTIPTSLTSVNVNEHELTQW